MQILEVSPVTFIYLALAAWRLASLFANEEGPFYCFEHLRKLAFRLCDRYEVCEKFGLSKLATCEWCNSVWIGFGLIWLYGKFPTVTMYLSLPLALSTAVIVIKYVVQRLER